MNTNLFSIHGAYRLPTGYSFAILPRNSVVKPRTSSVSAGTADSNAFAEKIEITSSGSWYKILASIFQVLFSYYTVYQDQGDSIKRWGYTSFFFSPSFYAVMSAVNLCGNLVTCDYPKIYMVHSDIMDEAIGAGGAFDGVIGRVIPASGPSGDIGHPLGFASSWKGISPTSIKRIFWKVFMGIIQPTRREAVRPQIKRQQTVVTLAQGADNICLLKQQTAGGQIAEGTIYKVQGVSIESRDGSQVLSSIFQGLSAAMYDSPLVMLLYLGYFVIRHLERATSSIGRWLRRPKRSFSTQGPLLSNSASIRQRNSRVESLLPPSSRVMQLAP